MERFKITCIKCGLEATIAKDDNGACGDPECCGNRVEYFVVSCESCKTHETIGE